MESFVEAWFKPLAYAFILLREAGFPCLFYGDYYGIEGQDGHAPLLDKLLNLRQNHAYGKQDDYFDSPTCLAWVRSGNEEYPHGCAILINTAEASHKRLFIGQDKACQVWRDSLGHCPEVITIGQDGWADFPVPAGSLGRACYSQT